MGDSVVAAFMEGAGGTLELGGADGVFGDVGAAFAELHTGSCAGLSLAARGYTAAGSVDTVAPPAGCVHQLYYVPTPGHLDGAGRAGGMYNGDWKQSVRPQLSTMVPNIPTRHLRDLAKAAGTVEECVMSDDRARAPHNWVIARWHEHHPRSCRRRMIIICSLTTFWS